ncbi:MAG: ABC transporter permease [Bacteriovoracia bacterium]
MLSYIVRRVIYMIPILFGITLVTFLLFNVAGGDPVLLMVGKHATPESIASLRHELGLDQPLWRQYLEFVNQIIHFDFGRSYSSKREVFQMIREAAPVSFVVAMPAFVISICLAISMSLFVAFWRGTWVDRGLVVASVLLISVPSLAYVLFGQYYLAYKWELFPISGFSFGFPEVVTYIALPVIILLFLTIGNELRFYRTVMLDEISQDYIRTARAKGLSERVVMFKHVLKNAMIPIITNIVIEIPFLIVGSLIIESFFAIPGMGFQLIDALNNADFPVIKANVVIFSLLYMVFNLLTDILYSLVDPRVSLG